MAKFHHRWTLPALLAALAAALIALALGFNHYRQATTLAPRRRLKPDWR